MYLSVTIHIFAPLLWHFKWHLLQVGDFFATSLLALFPAFFLALFLALFPALLVGIATSLLVLAAVVVADIAGLSAGFAACRRALRLLELQQLGG